MLGVVGAYWSFTTFTQSRTYVNGWDSLHNDGMHSPDHIPIQNGEVYKEADHSNDHHESH